MKDEMINENTRTGCGLRCTLCKSVDWSVFEMAWTHGGNERREAGKEWRESVEQE